MKSKKLLLSFILAVMFTVSFALAIPVESTTLESDVELLLSEIDGQPLHNDFKSIFGDEKIQITILRAQDETYMFAVVIEDDVIMASNEELTEPTLDITLSEETYWAIRESPNQMQAALDAYDNGDIKKDAHGFGKTVKFTVASAVLKVMSWFR